MVNLSFIAIGLGAFKENTNGVFESPTFKFVSVIIPLIDFEVTASTVQEVLSI